MSGIAGIYFRDGRPVERETLVNMVDVLAHRGPNKSGAWLDGPIGLGHRMLWTTPESLHEELPLVHRHGDLTITADARIDNRDDLIRYLRLDEQPDGQLADGELILAAYEKWGEHCPEYLLGAFAFAIWDERHQQLFCARDHFGVKPFYYYVSHRIFAFASEIKALFHLPGIPRQLNELRLASHLVPLDVDQASTLYDDILRLLPARYLTVGRQKVKNECYWDLDPSRELKLSSDKAYSEAFRELLFKAVRCRLRGATQIGVGSMLSGGLDSSSVASVAEELLAQAGKGPLPTFSAVFDDIRESDERVYIKAVFTKGRFESHYFHADGFGPLAEIESMLWHQDGLFDSGNLYLMWGNYRLARQHGVGVMLDGFDGDRVIPQGFCQLWALANNRRWFALARELRALENVEGGPSWRTKLWGYMRREFPQIEVMRRYLRRIRRLFRSKRPDTTAGGRSAQWNRIIDEAFARRIRLSQRQPIIPSFHSGREAHYWMLSGAGIGETFEELDKAGSAFGLEIRYPFFDRRLVEFCLSLPPEQQLNSGWTRMILRRAMEDILPRQVQWRPHKGDVVPAFDYGLLANSRSLIEDIVLGGNNAASPYVDQEVLRQIYLRLSSGNARPEDGSTVWKAVTLASWLQYWSRNRHISGATHI